MITKLDNPKVRQFIQTNIKEDPVNLVLQANKFPDLPIREIADQIASRQRAAKKLPEWYGNERVIFPPRQNLEQASSEVSARFKARFFKGKKMLDLTGGTGIDAFYMSENFEALTMVEPNPELCDLIRHNFSVFGRKVEVHQKTAEEFLESCTESYDMIFLDPSRRTDGNNRVFGLSEYVPNVLELKPRLFELSEHVFIKASPMVDITQASRELGNVKKVITLAVQHEMKDVLFIMQKEWVDEPMLESWNLTHSGEQFLSGLKSEEKVEGVEYAEPESYIYEPNSAIRKAGLFKTVASAFHLKKLHPQTHLYTGTELKNDFPGKIYELIEFIKPDKKSLKKRFKEGKVNVMAKNYPLGANEIKKKFGLKDGGEETLVFCEIIESGKMAFVCKQVLNNT